MNGDVESLFGKFLEDNMAKKAKTTLSVNAEMFDLNSVCVTGPVIAVWGRNGDVFVRLQPSPLQKESVPENFVNVCISNGMLDGVPVTLQKGDLLRVTGYIRQTKFSESIRNILTEAGSPKFIEDNVAPEDVGVWRSVRINRKNAMVQALKVETLKEIKSPENNIDLEGVIAEVWTYKHDNAEDLFVRLAIYDQNTIETKEEGNFGRKRRIPHYVNVRFPSGRPTSATDGTPLSLRKKQRMRVRGSLCDKWNVETLHDILFSSGSSDIMETLQRAKNVDELHQMRTQLESLHVLANAAVLYSR
jgi:hypothetical protein